MAVAMAQEWDLSHLDERLEKVLGHFRIDFQGGGALSPKRLGPKFGFFGSFLPMYKITKTPTLLPPKGTTYSAAKPAVSICFPRNASETAEAVEKIQQVDEKPLDQKPAIISAAKADEKIQRGTKRSLVGDDERRPLKIRIVYGSEKGAQKNVTESVPTMAAVEKRLVVGDEKRPLKIRFVFGSEKRAVQKNSIVAN